MRRAIAGVAFVALLLTVGVAAQAADWPGWRGANHDDISPDTGLLKEWPKGGPPPAWELDGLGNSYSSVAIVGGRLYTMGTIKREQMAIAVDLAQAQPKIAWTAKVSAEGGRPNCTPTVDDGWVYALDSAGNLVCVEASNGQVHWRKSFRDDFGMTQEPNWKFAESPLIDGDRLICTPGAEDALLVALNKKSGEVVWRCRLPDDLRGKQAHAQYASVMPVEAGGVRQYVTLIARIGLVGVAAKDGKFLWNYRKVVNGTANIATSVPRGEELFCSTAYGAGAALLKLSADAAEERYFLKGDVFQNHHGGFIRLGEHVYGGHGHGKGAPTCLEWKSGKVLWQEAQPGGGSAAVTAADGHLYYLYQDGVAALIEATPEAYRLKGKFQLPPQGGNAWAHPVVLDGKLYLRWGAKLFCYDVKAK